MLNVLGILFVGFIVAGASRCPESRKPHVTSCTIFYDCVNLPDGGYVWVPSKCADGLVFQPFLRLCVLPGDSWDCQDPTEQTPSTKTPELIDETKTSYHEINSSLNLHGLSNLGNLLTMIPYPLIEIKQTQPDDKKIHQEKENIPDEKIIKDSTSRFFLFLNFGAYLNNNQNFLPSSIENPSKEELIRLVRNYIINHPRSEDSKKKKKKTEMKKETLIPATSEVNYLEPEEFVTTPSSPTESILDDGATNHIVLITGNFGEKKYVTIDQYKELATNFKVQVLDVIPCMPGGIRLPNITDCVRYYTCDPTTANLHEFHCPPQTAFNTRTNFCDPQKYKSCIKNQNKLSTTDPSITKPEKLILSSSSNDSEKQKHYCESTGKFPVPMSNKFYYLCYLSKESSTVESIRMSCPNDLVFCQGRKVCTTRRLCLDSD